VLSHLNKKYRHSRCMINCGEIQVGKGGQICHFGGGTKTLKGVLTYEYLRPISIEYLGGSIYILYRVKIANRVLTNSFYSAGGKDLLLTSLCSGLSSRSLGGLTVKRRWTFSMAISIEGKESLVICFHSGGGKKKHPKIVRKKEERKSNLPLHACER